MTKSTERDRELAREVMTACTGNLISESESIFFPVYLKYMATAREEGRREELQRCRDIVGETDWTTTEGMRTPLRGVRVPRA